MDANEDENEQHNIATQPVSPEQACRPFSGATRMCLMVYVAGSYSGHRPVIDLLGVLVQPHVDAATSGHANRQEMAKQLCLACSLASAGGVG